MAEKVTRQVTRRELSHEEVSTSGSEFLIEQMPDLRDTTNPNLVRWLGDAAFLVEAAGVPGDGLQFRLLANNLVGTQSPTHPP